MVDRIAMFDAIAPSYDRLNAILSFGLDQRWRRAAVQALRLAPGSRILDVATGTGDLALEIARRTPRARVTGLDASEGMLSHARRKAAQVGLGARVEFVQGDAERMPLEDASFDAASIAFGFRNLTDRAAGLRELARVVVPGGRIAILELSDPPAAAIGRAARFYVHEVVPRIGAAISEKDAYGYLERSIAVFPPPREVEALIERTGIDVLYRRTFAFGVAELFVCRASDGSSPW